MRDDVDYLVKYNEPRDSPPRRLLFQFEGTADNIAVILINETWPEILLRADWFAGRQFKEHGPMLIIEGDDVLGIQNAASNNEIDLVESTSELSSFVLATDGRNLAIPTRTSGKKPTSAGDQYNNEQRWATLGLVITGKQFIRRPITRAYVLPKSVPTPFVADSLGDSYNDSFFKEPRVIEQAPETVVTAVETILTLARTLYSGQRWDVAGSKFRKAFHYCHSYYPESLEEPWLSRMTDLKIASLQNLALCSLRTNQWSQAIEAMDFVLDMPEIHENKLQKAKALYRRARARKGQGDDELALVDLRVAYNLVPDAAILREIAACEEQSTQRRQRLRDKLNKAFG